jgi:hypothetical protein
MPKLTGAMGWCSQCCHLLDTPGTPEARCPVVKPIFPRSFAPMSPQMNDTPVWVHGNAQRE